MTSKEQKSLEQSPEKKQFGYYTVMEVLGQGGMGVVYKVRDTRSNKIMALKAMNAKGQSELKQKRFLREAQTTAKLNHSNIIKVHDINQDKDQLYFAMDFVEGVLLQEFLKKNTTIRQMVKIAIKVTEAISYAHSQGFIHRDLKPSNIMIVENGRPIVMDFGLVKFQKASIKLSKAGTTMGTLQYMSPEQIQDPLNVDERCDVYSLGAMLYEMLVKKTPFQGGDQMFLIYQVLEGKIASPSELNSEIPTPLSQICLKAMARERENRYQNAKQLAKALKKFLKAYVPSKGTQKLEQQKTFALPPSEKTQAISKDLVELKTSEKTQAISKDLVELKTSEKTQAISKDLAEPKASEKTQKTPKLATEQNSEAIFGHHGIISERSLEKYKADMSYLKALKMVALILLGVVIGIILAFWLH